MAEGKVIRNTGSHYVVLLSDGSMVPTKAKGNFRIKGIRTTNPVAIGDRVDIGEIGPDGVAFITKVHPRKNYIIRRASNLSKEAHILASNLDQAMLVVSLVHPPTSTTFINRFLATAEAYNVPSVLVINKIDLMEGEEDHEFLDAMAYLYRSIGYRVIFLSAKTQEGLDNLKTELKDKTTLLSGNSGVGKSTIINDLIPEANQKTAQISEAHDQGTHTTTFSELFMLPFGGCIIDTPGIRGFGTIDFEKSEVSHFFPEIFAVSEHCRFNNCTHTHEPGCAVIEAVDENRIAQSRYASYLNILEDVDESKYRK